MLSKEAQKKLLKMLKVSDDTIKTLVDDDKENDVDISKEITVFTTPELTIRDTAKYKAGQEDGLEVAIKDYKKSKGLDFKGKKLEDFEKHLTENKEDADIVGKLRETITSQLTEIDNYKGQLSATKLQSKIHAFIPDLNNGMNKAEAESVMRANGFDWKEEGGSIVAYRNGDKVVDAKLQTALKAEDAAKSFFEEKKWIGDADANNDGKKGGGGGDSKTKAKPAFTRSSEVEKAFNEKYGPGASMGTEHDFAGHLTSVMKEMETAGTPLVMD